MVSYNRIWYSAVCGSLCVAEMLPSRNELQDSYPQEAITEKFPSLWKKDHFYSHRESHNISYKYE